MRIRHLLAGAAAGLCLASTSGFAAQTLVGNMTVSATVVGACTMATPVGLSFGTAVTSIPTAGVPEATTGKFTVVCGAAGVPVNVTLGTGLNAGGGTQRKLIAGANTLNYELYSDAARTVPWLSTGTGVAVPATSTSGVGVAQNVYGKLLGGATTVYPASGSYTDTVVVTVTY